MQKLQWKIQSVNRMQPWGGRHFHTSDTSNGRSINDEVPTNPGNGSRNFNIIQSYDFHPFGYHANYCPNPICRTGSQQIQVGFRFTQNIPDRMSISIIPHRYWLLLDSFSTLIFVFNKNLIHCIWYFPFDEKLRVYTNQGGLDYSIISTNKILPMDIFYHLNPINSIFSSRTWQKNIESR